MENEIDIEETCDGTCDESIELMQYAVNKLLLEHSHKIPTHQMIFLLVKTASKLAYDCAPNHKVAKETIEAGVETGFKMSIDIDNGVLH